MVFIPSIYPLFPQQCNKLTVSGNLGMTIYKRGMNSFSASNIQPTN
ncbi:MAG: hypothetical protein ACTHJ2_10070 [Candidatus Nitrosocosmicus sp.]